MQINDKKINENKYFLIESTTENIQSLMINHYIEPPLLLKL